MRRSARREVNRDSLELWLVTRGVGVSTRPPGHPDEYHGRVGKPGSRVNQDDTWIMAISAPDAVAANRFFEDATSDVDRRLHMALFTAYLGPASDPSLPERWRILDAGGYSDLDKCNARYNILALDMAFAMVLNRADYERRLLFWPSPEEAKTYVEENIRKRRDALYHYQRLRDGGDTPTLAVRKAANAARCTERAVWKWLAQTDRAQDFTKVVG